MLVCLSGSFRDLTFLPVILLNTVVGIVQEIRAKNVLEKMNMLNAPKTDVVREGKIRSIDSTHLVRDDIVIFNTGNQICADAVGLPGAFGTLVFGLLVLALARQAASSSGVRVADWRRSCRRARASFRARRMADRASSAWRRTSLSAVCA